MRPHEGSGGGVPRPRKLKAASARIASANVTEDWIMTRAKIFGSTCRLAIRNSDWAALRAAAIKSEDMICRVPARATLANPGPAASPIASMADNVLAPMIALVIMARSNAGKEIGRAHV